mmetsp:Transcript_78502/g.138253  ORF Transcript_78502/g.138253 Transcript_78502/m.138253 type:complete len:242 (+) Transcript_78502:801-1526(+)
MEQRGCNINLFGSRPLGLGLRRTCTTPLSACSSGYCCFQPRRTNSSSCSLLGRSNFQAPRGQVRDRFGFHGCHHCGNRSYHLAFFWWPRNDRSSGLEAGLVGPFHATTEHGSSLERAHLGCHGSVAGTPLDYRLPLVLHVRPFCRHHPPHRWRCSFGTHGRQQRGCARGAENVHQCFHEHVLPLPNDDSVVLGPFAPHAQRIPAGTLILYVFLHLQRLGPCSGYDRCCELHHDRFQGSLGQ